LKQSSAGGEDRTGSKIDVGRGDTAAAEARIRPHNFASGRGN
jgi:hypothetical protein